MRQRGRLRSAAVLTATVGHRFVRPDRCTGGAGAAAGRGSRRAVPAGPRPNVGAADRHRVDPAAADRGRKIYAAECVTCHGPSARGTERGANLIRSPVVLRDRYGNSIGPLLKKGHPMQTGAPSASLTDAQITDLSHFIWQRINDTLRGSPVFEPGDVLVGDAEGGRGLLQRRGPLRHLPLADRRPRRLRQALSAARDPAALRVPEHRRRRAAAARRVRRASRSRSRSRCPTAPRVRARSSAWTTSTSRCATPTGEYRSWTRTPAMKIVKNDPLRRARRAARSPDRQGDARCGRLPGDAEMRACQLPTPTSQRSRAAARRAARTRRSTSCEPPPRVRTSSAWQLESGVDCWRSRRPSLCRAGPLTPRSS